MERHYLLEDRETGEIVVCDNMGQERARFEGAAAVHQALHWAKARGVDIYSSRAPDEVNDRHRFIFRRGLRLFRMGRGQHHASPSQDPPNVTRIIVDEDDDPWGVISDYDAPHTDDNIELAPQQDEDSR